MTDSGDTLLPTASQTFANHVIGPPFAGWLASIFFTGILTCWAFNYVRSPAHQEDRRITRAWFYAVMLLCYGQLGITCFCAMHYGTWQQRDETTLFAQTAGDCLATFFVGFEGALVQIFLARRVSVVITERSIRYAYFGTVVLSCLLGLTGAMLYLVLSIVLRNSDNVQESLGALTFNVATGIWLWACAFTDVVISVSMMLALRKRIAGFNVVTDSVLKRIIMVAFESASYTAVVAVLGAVLSFSFPGESLNANSATAFWALLAPFYALSMLNILDSRSKIAKLARSDPVLTPSFVCSPNLQNASTLQADCGHLHPNDALLRSPVAGFFVVKEVAIHIDDEEKAMSEPTFTFASIEETPSASSKE